MMDFQDLTIEQAIVLFEESLSKMDDEEFFRTLGTSVEELRVKAETLHRGACEDTSTDH